MRVLFLTQFFQPEPIFKGLPFARALRDRGHEVEVLTGFPNYPGGRLYPGYRIKPWQREVMEGISVTRVPLYPSHGQSGLGRAANYLSFGLSAALIGAIQVRRPDVVYVYNLVTLARAWRLLRWRHKCAVVLDVQDLWPESVLSSGMLKVRGVRALLERWCRTAYRSADRLTVLSPGFKQNLVQRGIPAEKIDVIYNWCDETPLPILQQVSAAAAAAGFPGRFNVLFAGTMGKVQALGAVIEAARRLRAQAPAVQFSFVGGGIEVENLKRQASGLDNVQFLPRCSASEALTLAVASDALLVHLRDDPLFSITVPSKTQSYLYAGRPILMGVKGDAADLVRKAGAGLCFEPENAESLARAVLDLHGRSQADREQMGANGRCYYQAQLAFERGVRAFEASFAVASTPINSVERSRSAVRAKASARPN